ncbi:DegT/DnrJ/EryC1/StrS family aminotransferase [Novipirellula artificiosorum]|uniref:UDP-2-acetamido-2-deoxy-3-oxo-D-glucuronate aminotransferase n=1 Tax=Novipirellula artificiosorum TaxID=2528016 RepID=A0A5C6E0A1_9BACT|nr:DegT/DnrJ/EryC1/StrS family aminotransferase [Novipirellula artificiosorum]TWU42328.1 UDP-2-acetamido-2-deoxy-3-oxo-D-glucuronate aminotransferase [Novipirellula artificiosorum]
MESSPLEPLMLPKWPPQSAEIESAALECLKTGDWGRYDSNAKRELMDQLCNAFAAEHVRLCCSGTAAIELCLRAAGVGRGDEVIISAFDYPGNLRSVELLGARPVLVNASKTNFGPDLESVSLVAHDRATNSAVRAVIASHLYGHASEMEHLRQICDDRNWTLIEDVCQCPGMVYPNQAGDPVIASAYGHIATLSFGGSKPLTAGNGGAILTSDPRLAARLASLVDRPSDAFPLSPLQAAVLIPQINRLIETNVHRQRVALRIDVELRRRGTPIQCLIESASEIEPTYYKLAMLASSRSDRDEIVRRAHQQGMPIGESFRSMSKVSERRCRKPVPLDQADDYSDRLCLLDHRALLIEEDLVPRLVDRIVAVVATSVGD